MSSEPKSAEEAVEVFLARRRGGESLDAASFAAEHPGLEPELTSALRALLALESATGPAGSPDPTVPERIGAYRVVRELGRGGMGVVLEAVEDPLGRRVALKILPPELLASSSARARFRREAELASRLDHSGIATIYGAGVEDQRPWIAMRYIEGQNLARAISQSRREGGSCLHLAPAAAKGREAALRVAGLVVRVARALHSAHEQGVVHRDIKPSNIIVQPDGSPVLLDFGLAIEPESDAPSLTRTGEAPGTPAYLAPEGVSGELPRPDVQSDVYALGVTLYECLALRRPFDAPTPAALYRAILAGAPTGLRALNPSVSRDLAVVTATAMERDRSRRYRSASALADDLEACVAGRPIAARPVPIHGRLLRWARREPRLAVAIAAAILIAVGGFSWVSLVQTAAGRTVAGKNKDLEATNLHLAAAKTEAEANERIAVRKADDVLSLSAIQDLKELEARADALWPADPGNVAKYEAWLADARLLVEGRPGDPAQGVKKRPSLAEHKGKLAEIRLRAKPRSPEQVEADRRASPRLAEWERERAKLSWMRRMLSEEPWPVEAEAEAALSKEDLPDDGDALNTLAWLLVDVDPARIVYGSETRGLALARRAVAAVKEGERAMIRDTLAWALYRCGRLDEALAEERRAVAEATDRRKEQLSSSLERMEEQVALWKPDGGRSKQVEEATKLAARVAELASSVSEGRTYEFEDGEDRWWYAQLSQLVSDLDAFTDETTGGLDSWGISEKHGWGIMKRKEFARTIVERSLGEAEAKRRWEGAIAAIAASSKYGGLKLEPQLGLLPIGQDPESGLWEFAHLQTGEPAERGEVGKLILREGMGLVFVLIPGGTFRMGAQRTEPKEPNYDPQASGDESPVHEVTLSPYFLSKFEMTQGQWLRFTGRNPSSYGPGAVAAGHLHNLLHPVEQVNWTQCSEVMTRLGLVLASEAQWECGCRGGTDTAWWTGADRESLRGRVNLADQTARKAGAPWSAIDDWPDLEDGWAVHAAIGSFPGNPFGLHEVLGNVWEWCLDGYDVGFYGRSPRVDPLGPTAGAQARVFRGGGFDDDSASARVTGRALGAPEYQANAIGLRPARALAGN